MAPIATLAVRLSAQIAEFQAAFTEAQKSTEKFRTSVVDTAKTVATTLGVGFGVNEIRKFVQSTLDAASRINDLSQRLGVSTDAIQEFQFVANQTGSTVEDFANAVFKLGVNIAGGGTGVQDAINGLGLSFNQIRNLKPEQQFELIAVALGNLENEQERNRVGTELFGKSFKEIAAAIGEGYDKLAEKSTKATKQQIKDLDDAGDKLQEFADHFQTVAIIGLGQIVEWGNKADAVILPFADHVGELGRKALDVIDPLGQFGRALKDLAASMPTVPTISLPQPAAIGGGLSIDELIRQGDELTEQVKRSIKVHEEAAKAADDYRKSVKSLRDELSGAALQSDVRKLQDAFDGLTSSQRGNADVIWRVAEAAERLREGGAALSQELLDIVVASGKLSPGLNQARIDFAAIGEVVDVTIPKLDAYRQALQTIGALPKGTLVPEPVQTFGVEVISVAEMLKGVTRESADAMKAVNELASAFSQLANVAGGGLGDIVRDLGTLVASLSTANKSIDAFQAGKKAFSAGDTLAGIAGMTSGILGIASAAISAGKAIANLFDRNKGRDLVTAFAGEHGGFDALHQELLELGDSGEQLWIKLTQGVGRNNKDQARAAIEEVTAALEAFRKKQDDVVTTTATVDTAQTKLADNIKARLADLNSEYDSLAKSVANEAPEEFMGIVEQQQRARMSQIAEERKGLETQWEALQSTIQESLDGIGQSAKDAAKTIEDAFKNIKIPKFKAEFDTSGFSVPGGYIDTNSLPAPTSDTWGMSQNITVNVDGAVIASAAARGLPAELTVNGI